MRLLLKKKSAHQRTIRITSVTLNNIDDLQKISRQTFYETFCANNTAADKQKGRQWIKF